MMKFEKSAAPIHRVAHRFNAKNTSGVVKLSFDPKLPKKHEIRLESKEKNSKHVLFGRKDRMEPQCRDPPSNS